MRINKIIIENFKSIYGRQEFDFSDLEGLIKLSGPIGSGKSTLSEAIRVGLYGNIKDNNAPNYVAWNTDAYCIELELISKNRNIYIRRHFREQLQVKVNGKDVAASSKRDMQSILEDFYDVPRLAVEKMCVITFDQFNSLAKMNPGQTKAFLDDVFGFKTFTEYNENVVIERKKQIKEKDKLDAIYADTSRQINYLQEKKRKQSNDIHENINIEELQKERQSLVDECIELKKEKERLSQVYNDATKDLKAREQELLVLGKKESEYYNKYKSGICPTCGQKMPEEKLKEAKEKVSQYRNEYKQVEGEIQKYLDVCTDLTIPINQRTTEIKERIRVIDNEIMLANNSIKLMNENYDDLLRDYSNKLIDLKNQIDDLNMDIGEWDDMNELFTKTLRYKLLESLIPHINDSIQYYITKLERPYRVKFDQEFKCHIYTDTYEQPISYNALSTGQRKSIDVCIIFGIIQNIIANVDFNIFFLDELFSNMDADSRDVMLNMLRENLTKDGRTIFIVNHAEMSDDYFDHKIKVKLNTKKILKKTRKKNGPKEDIVIYSSNYEKVY